MSEANERTRARTIGVKRRVCEYGKKKGGGFRGEGKGNTKANNVKKNTHESGTGQCLPPCQRELRNQNDAAESTKWKKNGSQCWKKFTSATGTCLRGGRGKPVLYIPSG